jgi:ADP-glucose pyrophosphorylase
MVGTALVNNLKNIRDNKNRTRPNIKIEEVYEYDIDSTPEELDSFCQKADFVFNLAGVNRPENPEDFMKGNFGFASDLLNNLKKYHNQATIMLSSSIQAKFISYCKEKQTSCVMRYYEPSEKKLLKCGVLTVDENNLVLNMTEKSPTPATHWCCPPFYYYTKADAARVSDGIAAGCGTDAPGSFIAWLCKETKVHAMEMPGSRYDIGNLESYENVKKKYKGISKC